MGLDYALVHLKYTIPPAVLLTAIYFPLFTRLDLYKIAFLITIAVTSTIPWDSYLIRTNVWSYPPDAVIGLKLVDIPLEEVFFFVIQTYNTSLLYLLLSKPVFHPIYLVREGGQVKSKETQQKWRYIKLIGQLPMALVIKKAVEYIRAQGKHTYLGLILVWATPFLWLLWTLAYQFLVRLPLTSTLVPIMVPTAYLWVVDTLALKRGTWVIESGTKTGLTLWPGLEIEEALFFFLTNSLIVAGLVAFDNALAILNTFPKHFPHVPSLPSPVLLVRALLLPAAAYDDDRIIGLEQAVERLRSKSRSFYLASSTFQGRLRNDLTILYSFCRVADDLIDNAQTTNEAKEWIDKLRRYLDHCYAGDVKRDDGTMIAAKDVNAGPATMYAMSNFPPENVLTLFFLPTDRLAKEPLYELLKGFEMDLSFTSASPNGPIKSETDLDLYGGRVAGTVALLCIQLALYHYPGVTESKARDLMAAGHDMGIALQYTNIARDLSVDAQHSRVYVPSSWLKKEKLTPESFIAGFSKTKDADDFFLKKVNVIRHRLLDSAFAFYERSRDAIEMLPGPARAPMRVAVESYMQIGRELRRPGSRLTVGRATVPKWKRWVVGWRALVGPMR
ncbi:Phytoene synthase [Teratosphaeria destructans]|uniref:Bifunctional lycopene cyclase/phytoene synthase n=1 Tax=Teratosphaeria destructans TaxID=418781 RepID=A0A9W7W357_9PEZI|nr:Phytoene synthase [Teratosphaeria destructans]